MNAEFRVARLWLIFAVFFGLVFFNLFRMQILRGDEFRALSEKNRLRVRVLEAPRGRILDRTGKPLADNRLSFNCSLFPFEARKHLETNFNVLAPILGLEPEVLQERNRKAKPGQYGTILLAEDLPVEQASRIEEQLDSLAGVLVETRPVRQYPDGEAVGHLTGYVGPQTEAEVDQLEEAGYRPSDWIGRTGLEAVYETYLHGKSGGLQMEVNSRGRLMRALGVREPQEGKDIQLSVDAGLQRLAHKLLDGRRGAVVVLDVRDGAVIALDSSPAYDPNLFASATGRKKVGEYFTDKRSPMLNRAVQSAYPPGSVFKIFTALAALGGKKISESTRFHCPGFLLVGGKRFGCWKEGGHGSQDLTEAFAHSCDVFFYQTGLAAGPEAIRAAARVFGLSEKTGMDLPGERSGHVPSPEWKRKKKRVPWFDGDTANFSIGQGYLQTTPVQIAVATAAVATGEIVRPHLTSRIGGVSVVSRRASTPAIPKKNLEVVRRGLLQVVQSDTGTGKLSRIPGISIAGKTGTAETGPGRPTHAWYAGYAPFENPQVAMCVFLEGGGHGGVEAASVAHEVWAWLKDHGYLGVPAVAPR